MKEEIFRIKSIRISGNNIFEKDINFVLYEDNDNPKEPYSTVMIGPNGTGKSNFLRLIILLCSGLYELKTKDHHNNKINGKYSMIYEYDSDIYEYTNINAESDFEEKHTKQETAKKPYVKKNGKKVLNKDVEIPKSILAISNSITDKFPEKLKNYKSYNYLGVKTSPGTARASSFVRKTVDFLYEAIDIENTLINLEKILTFLQFETYLRIWYIPRYKKHIFVKNLTTDKFKNFFQEYWKYMKRDKGNPPWSLDYFKKIEQDEIKIKDLVNLCKKLHTNFKQFSSSKSEYFEIDVFDENFSKKELRQIKELYQLDLISYPSLSFKKNKINLEIEELSSGEYHFITNMIGIMAKIQNHSIVVIDEPENSLHPNWQMKYISFIKKIFNNFKSAHFIFATHSHLMISDLKGNSSSVIALKKEKNISVESIPYNTYGWSGEEILIKVFETASSRNYYLTNKLSEIFELIAKEPNNRNEEIIRGKVSKLKEIDLSGLSTEDPLKDVIKKLYETF